MTLTFTSLLIAFQMRAKASFASVNATDLICFLKHKLFFALAK